MAVILKYKGILSPEMRKTVENDVQRAMDKDGIILIDDQWEVVHTDGITQVDITKYKEV